jgi:hypothetical protein
MREEEQTWESLLERLRAGRERAERRACNCAACAEDPDYEDACEEVITRILDGRMPAKES